VADEGFGYAGQGWCQSRRDVRGGATRHPDATNVSSTTQATFERRLAGPAGMRSGLSC
jgi:hypothetical protein